MDEKTVAALQLYYDPNATCPSCGGPLERVSDTEKRHLLLKCTKCKQHLIIEIPKFSNIWSDVDLANKFRIEHLYGMLIAAQADERHVFDVHKKEYQNANKSYKTYQKYLEEQNLKVSNAHEQMSSLFNNLEDLAYQRKQLYADVEKNLNNVEARKLYLVVKSGKSIKKDYPAWQAWFDVVIKYEQTKQDYQAARQMYRQLVSESELANYEFTTGQFKVIGDLTTKKKTKRKLKVVK